MTNPEIARAFQLLAKLMELHGENPFKIRSYQNAYMKLRKLERPLTEMSLEEIGDLPGIGAAITGKIDELRSSGSMDALQKWLAQTPPGVVEMLGISGFGPKKVRAVWDGLKVESIGELLYAVNENRLVELKGFGAKTQADLKKKLEFTQRSSGRFHYRTAEQTALRLSTAIEQQFGADIRCEPTGAFRRRQTTLTEIEWLTTLGPQELARVEALENLREKEGAFHATYEDIPVVFHQCPTEQWGTMQFVRTGSEAFLENLDLRSSKVNEGIAKLPEAPDEADIFAHLQLPFVAPELRENNWAIELARAGQLPVLLEETDIRGVIHSHTTWSDGINSLREMAEGSRAAGYDYILITDHSKSAFYANGLKEDRLREQWAEIDALNLELAPFRILKGIESDILNDGSLDYDDDILARFDLVIASVHSNLRMDETKATERLITAIKNPYTHILGHPTGRLLLSREGYPIDHLAVIEACAEHGVSIELNANPYRLDLDWSWIPAALEKGVPICINPDAHSVGGIGDIRYGVLAARKGGLTAAACLNTRSVDDFLAWFGKQ